MKKIMAIAVGILLCIALAVPLFAESQGITPPAGTKVLFEDDFSDALDTAKWSVRGKVKISSGWMSLGEGGSWVDEGYSATANGTFSDYVLDFDFTGDQRDCYYGVGIRAKANGGSEFQNGGRFGVPSASEKAAGISFDLFIKPDGAHIGVALNNGGANGDCAQFLVANPEGYNGSSGHVTVIDAGDTVTMLINNTEVVTLKLGENAVTAYDAAGEKLYEGSAEFPASGSFSFYQRNDLFKIDNVKVTSLYERDFSSELGDNLSFDQILYDDVLKAEGTAPVNELKVLVDGSDGSISKLGLYGWYGNRNSKTASYGYTIDGGAPVFDDSFFFTTSAEDQANIEGVNPNGLRYKVVIDVTKITDGKTHKIYVVAKLENGQIVTLNRNEPGKDREVYVNYKAVAEPKANIDFFQVNGAGDNHNTRDSGDSITIKQGDKITTLGWIFKYGTNVKRVYWQYVEAGGKIKDGPIMDCSDTYRKREDVAQYFGFGPDEYQYFAKSGFGLDNDPMVLTGIGDLPVGEYDARFVAEFEDGTTEVIKKKFTLKVEAAAPEATELVGHNFDEAYFNVLQVRVRGWARLNSELDGFGYRIDDGDVVYNAAFQVDRSDVWNAFGVTKEVANGFDLNIPATDIPAGKHTFTLVVKAKDGTVIDVGQMPIEMPHEEQYTNIVDFDDISSYGMSVDGFWWNGGAIGNIETGADLFVRPDAMPVNDYGGLSTGYNGWVAFKQKVKGFGYIVNDKLFVSDTFTQANEDTLAPTVDSWEGWAGSGETVQRYNVQIPFAGMSGVSNVMAAAILEDGTVVRLNSKAIHNRDTEIDFVFNDARDYYCDPNTLDTGYWNNPFNSSSVATINFKADEWFNGFETFIYASDAAQKIHMTLKDAEGNVLWEEDFNMVNNQRYTFYKRGAKFAPGDYTVEFDGRNMAADAGTWIVFGSANPVDGKTVTASGNYGSNAGLTGVSFYLIKTTEFKEGMSRDQVTVNNVDKAKVGGNDAVTDITENLYPEIGQQIRFWGWYGNNTVLEKFGVKIDGGEMIYFDRYEEAGIVNHLKGVFKEDAVSAARFNILVDITEGKHTAEVYAITDRGEVLVWTINYFCLPEEAPAGPELTAKVNDAGKLVVTATGEFGEKDWIGVYADGTTPGGDGASLVWWYVGANGGTFEVPFDGMNENNRAALLNDDGTVKAGKFVVYLLANDGYGLVEGTEGNTITVEEKPVTEPETQPQTGDAAVAMFAVIAVLAMGAAVVFIKKRAF